MHDVISLNVNGRRVAVPSGATVAVAMVVAGDQCRTSVIGQARGPLCGMGVCFECRVTINAKPHCRSCQVECEAGMEVKSEV